MIDNLLLALQITAIGMGLVFGSIILFWLIMAVLVRLIKPGSEQTPEGDLRQGGLQENVSPEGELRRRRAAAAAVAVALAQQSGAAQPLAGPASPMAQASAWQVVQRAKSLRIFPRGPSR
ncbi:MAG: sodium pump decarboxylase subunit gamma [Anaerolineae bacterium]|nr:sodium pump decarboxylase subunit gamma [Anaerolineae bacterium]